MAIAARTAARTCTDGLARGCEEVHGDSGSLQVGGTAPRVDAAGAVR